jgi:hypothetical protein
MAEQKGKTIPHRGFPCGHPPETNSIGAEVLDFRVPMRAGMFT